MASAWAESKLNTLNSLKAPFSVPGLGYSDDGLLPYIDAETMKIHRGKHHTAYVDNLNKALGSDATTLEELLKNVSSRDIAIRNNAGGHWNHSFFWTVMTPDTTLREIPKRLKLEIENTFGSVETFKTEFEKKGLGQFGSGWVWLIRSKEKKLEISSTSNQDNPLMDVVTAKGTPILGVDVWEHAYYLNYQNRRADYLKSFWNVVNWNQVNNYDLEAIK